MELALTFASVSVVIPCHNGELYLSEAISSAFTQTAVPLEVVVVDDGSTDHSAAIAESIPGVRLIRQTNLGVSEARNHGLRETRGEFVIFHDADDRLLRHAIETGLAAFEANPECGFVYGFSTQIDADGSSRGFSSPRVPVIAGYETILAGFIPVPPSSVLFRRSALEAVGGFRNEQALAEDLDLYLRMAQRFSVFCHEQVVVEYRWHGANTSGRSPSRTLRAALETLDRQRPVVGTRPQLLSALDQGRRYFCEMFGESLAFEFVEKLRTGALLDSFLVLGLVLRYSPRGLLAAARGTTGDDCSLSGGDRAHS